MTINSKEYFEAKKRLSEFLEKHPEMKPAQAKLEDQLIKLGSNHNRLVFLKMKMEEKLIQLKKALHTLLKLDKPEGL